MGANPTKLVGLSIESFEKLISSKKEMHLRPARLIPFYKPDDEMAITSIVVDPIV